MIYCLLYCCIVVLLNMVKKYAKHKDKVLANAKNKAKSKAKKNSSNNASRTNKASKTNKANKASKTNNASRTSKYSNYSQIAKSNKLIDHEDSSLLDFKRNKYMSAVSSVSDAKSRISHIGELYDYPQFHDKMNIICKNKIMNKDKKLNKNISAKICECLFEKNKNLTIHDLETSVKNKTETPSTHCITIYDDYIKKQNK